MEQAAAVLSDRKKNLKKRVEVSAAPPPPQFEVVDSAAVQGIRDEYISMCRRGVGGLRVVYDAAGTGKSTAIPAVARGCQWFLQPHRFLHMDIQSHSLTCRQWYELVQKELGVKGLGLSPYKVAEVIHHALVGSSTESGVRLDLWPETERTSDEFRFHFEFTFPQLPYAIKSYPILVLDEFNPSHFADDKWDDDTDYTANELVQAMGESIQFLAALAELAHQGKGGFVVYVVTRYRSVAKAILKLNGAALARCTTKLDRPWQRRGIGAWRGLPPWTEADKRSLLEARFQQVRSGRAPGRGCH